MKENNNLQIWVSAEVLDAKTLIQNEIVDLIKSLNLKLNESVISDLLNLTEKEKNVPIIEIESWIDNGKCSSGSIGVITCDNQWDIKRAAANVKLIQETSKLLVYSFNTIWSSLEPISYRW